MQRDLVLYIENLRIAFNTLPRSRLATSVMTGDYAHVEHRTKMLQSSRHELPAKTSWHTVLFLNIWL